MIALVTGGSRGIGKAIVEKFESEGITVWHPTRQELDLSSNESIQAYLSSLPLEQIDIVVNNAGINELSTMDNLSMEALMKSFQVNCLSSTLITQALLPSFRAKKFGRIVNIGSIWTERAFPQRGAYSMAKSAMYGMTKMVAVENAAFNVLCNMVSPGFIATEMTSQNNNPAQIAEFLKKVPVGQMGKPQDVADLVYFLSVNNQFINGQNIFIDGGYTALA